MLYHVGDIFIGIIGLFRLPRFYLFFYDTTMLSSPSCSVSASAHLILCHDVPSLLSTHSTHFSTHDYHFSAPNFQCTYPCTETVPISYPLSHHTSRHDVYQLIVCTPSSHSRSQRIHCQIPRFSQIQSHAASPFSPFLRAQAPPPLRFESIHHNTLISR